MASDGEIDGGGGGGRESSEEAEAEAEEEQVSYVMGKMSEYEKQRFSRIAENKSRLESLLGPSLKPIKTTRKPNEDDEDYKPDEADDDDEEEEDECFGNSIYERKKNKRKLVFLSSKNNSDQYLNKATSLSLHKRINDDDAELMSKMQMTEDELVIYFYQFDEAGKGFITMRDVMKMATLHDFTWTEEELQVMIRCFDNDKDGKLSLDEFRKIVTRCRLLKPDC